MYGILIGIIEMRVSNDETEQTITTPDHTYHMDDTCRDMHTVWNNMTGQDARRYVHVNGGLAYNKHHTHTHVVRTIHGVVSPSLHVRNR